MSSIRLDDDPHADFADWLRAQHRELADMQVKQVEGHLRRLLAEAGLDPDDRSDGWQDRARSVFEGLVLEQSTDMEDGSLTLTTVIRRRS